MSLNRIIFMLVYHKLVQGMVHQLSYYPCYNESRFTQNVRLKTRMKVR
ncbi:hypothetical protein PAECIP111891_06146 [Paenibacillus allorhizoplanae]|uniref:Uncharacterized protein n=1 Tax=Paenibacillus allorhizoplanae TaxID=2905648 RepID=A0ABN8H4H4_9BACL|nr:hypothetical protein PAECIP111891_06146 [Paenibacillus allorhizoplanae]